MLSLSTLSGSLLFSVREMRQGWSADLFLLMLTRAGFSSLDPTLVLFPLWLRKEDCFCYQIMTNHIFSTLHWVKAFDVGSNQREQPKMGWYRPCLFLLLIMVNTSHVWAIFCYHSVMTKFRNDLLWVNSTADAQGLLALDLCSMTRRKVFWLITTTLPSYHSGEGCVGSFNRRRSKTIPSLVYHFQCHTSLGTYRGRDTVHVNIGWD